MRPAVPGRRRAIRAARLRWGVTLACLLLAAVTAAPAAARAAWGIPFELSPPGTLDYLSPQLALSAGGAVAATFSVGDVDTPGSFRPYLVTRSPGGHVGRQRAVLGAGQVLSLAYDGQPLELLVATSAQNQDCCASAGAIQVSRSGAVSRPLTIVSGLAGATQGKLLRLDDGQLMAAVATERGVWVTQSTRAGRFGVQHRISDAGQEPVSMAAAALGGEATIVAWTAGTGVIGATTPRTIDYATGSRTQAPQRARIALTVPAGHRIDELAVARSSRGATLIWVESWFDRRGSYHARVETADLAGKTTARALSPDNRLASGLSVGNDVAGDQAAAWESCTASAACTVQAAGRPAGGSFGPARTLGAIDSDESPALTLSPAGQVLIGWVLGGHPVASVGFGSASMLSSTTFATDPTVVFGPRHQAVAAWTQGTLNPSVVAAAYRGG